VKVITVSPRAKKAVRVLAEGQQKSGDLSLRVGVAEDQRHPGQTRLRYVVNLDNSGPQPRDHVFVDGELRVIVADESLAALDGLEVDADLEGRGVRFVFRNPNAQRTCRCGQTFQPE
jgi:iron-sulfur cluster assembly protein